MRDKKKLQIGGKIRRLSVDSTLRGLCASPEAPSACTAK
jgi:hypothetical protein